MDSWKHEAHYPTAEIMNCVRHEDQAAVVVCPGCSQPMCLQCCGRTVGSQHVCSEGCARAVRLQSTPPEKPESAFTKIWSTAFLILLFCVVGGVAVALLSPEVMDERNRRRWERRARAEGRTEIYVNRVPLPKDWQTRFYLGSGIGAVSALVYLYRHREKDPRQPQSVSH